MVSSTVGSSTITGWKRRSSAAFFSMCSRYSSMVVAPTHCSSPLASAGFSMLLASMAPSAAPAPTTVCSSSMKRMISPLACMISFITLFRRSSNSPRNLEPATSALRSSAMTRLPFRLSGTLPAHDHLRQPLHDGRLADTGLADEHRVVLGPARQDLDDARDLLVAADDRVQLAFARQLGQVAAVLLQHAVSGLGVGIGGALGAADLFDGQEQLVGRDAQVAQDAGGRRVGLAGDGQQQVLAADDGIAHALALGVGGHHHRIHPRRGVDLGDRRD